MEKNNKIKKIHEQIKRDQALKGSGQRSKDSAKTFKVHRVKLPDESKNKIPGIEKETKKDGQRKEGEANVTVEGKATGDKEKQIEQPAGNPPVPPVPKKRKTPFPWDW